MLFPLKKQMRIPPVKKIHLKKQKLYPENPEDDKNDKEA